MRRISSLLLIVLLGAACAHSHAQTFDLEQFDQLFRPRLSLDARYLPGVALRDRPGSFSDRTATAVVTVPLWRRWSARVELDTQGGSWPELLKNSLRVRASQVMLNLRYSPRELLVGDEPHTLHAASIGVLGIRLTKRYRILFWGLNANVSEASSTLDRAVPRPNGIIGRMHVKGSRRQVFYGLAVSVNDGLILPLPFVGGRSPLGDRWSFHYMLPVQLAAGYKVSQRTRLMAGVRADGYRSGFPQGSDRVNLNYTGLCTFAHVRHKLSGTFQLRAEVNWLPVHALRIPDAAGTLQRIPLDAGASVLVCIHILFGESTLERILGEVFGR